MVQLASLPTYSQPLTMEDHISKVWYRFFADTHTGRPQGSEYALAPSGSPYTFIAPSAGFVIVQGGTVSAIAFSRNGTTFYPTGQTQGCVPVSAGDTLVITYSSVPALTFVPQ